MNLFKDFLQQPKDNLIFGWQIFKNGGQIKKEN